MFKRGSLFSESTMFRILLFICLGLVFLIIISISKRKKTMAEMVVMMLGPRAVGKTTLLATMYKELIRFRIHSKFDFMAVNDTGIDLDEAYQKLKAVTAQPNFKPIGPLLSGTAGIVKHQFEIQFNNTKELDITFCDIAGGLLLSKQGCNDVDEFKAQMEKSNIFINVIDGAALVEGSVLFSDSINRPTRVRDLLKSAIDAQSKSNHLILFVITKCETWLKEHWLVNSDRKLREAFETRFKEVLNLIEGKQNVVGVYMPVKTLGCVEFSRIEEEEGEERVIFVRKPNLEFNPELVDQPLRYALAFALAEMDKNRGFWSRTYRWFSGEDKLFRDALSQFANERRRLLFKMYGNTGLTGL